jgi:hypothetical protein
MSPGLCALLQFLQVAASQTAGIVKGLWEGRDVGLGEKICI